MPEFGSPSSLQLPSGGGQLRGHPADQSRGVAGGGVEGGHVDLGWKVCKRLQELDKRVPDA
jgi:hypothetical protein